MFNFMIQEKLFLKNFYVERICLKYFELIKYIKCAGDKD